MPLGAGSPTAGLPAAGPPAAGPPADRIILNIDGQQIVLTGETPQIHFTSPFGEPIDTTPPGAPPPDPDPDEAIARYTGHERDQSTGLTYMKGRYQHPASARFTRPDPQRDGSWLAPHTLNLYGYVGNDPLNHWDPNGFEWTATKTQVEGKTVIKFKFTGVIYNSSSQKINAEQMNRLSSRAQKSIEEGFSRDFEDVTFQTEVELKTVQSESEIGEKDHRIVLVDGEKIGGAAGRTDQIGGLISMVNVGLVDNLPANSGEFAEAKWTSEGKSTFDATSGHEAGHTAGLEDNKSEGDRETVHLMNQHGWGIEYRSHQLNFNQFLKIYFNIRDHNGDLINKRPEAKMPPQPNPNPD